MLKHRVVAADRHLVPAPFRAFAVRCEEPPHALDARVPYGRVHVVSTDFLDAESLAGLAAEARSRTRTEAFSDIDYGPTTLQDLAAAAPRVPDLVGRIAEALQLTGVLGDAADDYRRSAATRIDYLACCGAGFHNDVARHWPSCLFWILALEVADVEFVMPHAGLRLALAPGDLLIFDPAMAHGLCRPADGGQALARSFEAGEHRRQLFLTGELRLGDAQWAALGAPWLPVQDHERQGALDLMVASFDDRSGAIQRPRALRDCMKAVAAGLALCAGLASAGEQQLVFGPTVAWARTVDGDTRWSIRVQGRVFEPAERSRKRQLAIDALARQVPVDRHDKLYRERAAHFVSDSESRVRVAVAIGDTVRTLPPTDAAGCFGADIELSADEAARLERDGRIAFEALPGPDRPAAVPGSAVRVAPEGLIVVTDVDDTIKHTDIPHPDQARLNTFVRPFEPVPGMPELYRSWAAAGGERVHFHVVSAGPWQFHTPLQRFTVDAGYPAFSWDMRCVDVTNPVVLVEETLKADPARLARFKVATIRTLIQRWPQRRFVLVGDSGERDPEAYAQMVAEFGERVVAIYIRNVSGEGPGARRYLDLFGPLGAMGRLQVFENAEALPRRLDLGR